MKANTKTLKTLAAKVRCESRYGATVLNWDRQSEWQRKAHPYRVTLRYQRRQLSVDFWMGQAHTSEPDAYGVLDCLLSDANSPESFEDFCQEFGYDSDSREAERIYKACQQIAPKVRRLLGDDFETFMYSER